MIFTKKLKGFTLLETILVLGIAGIAATLALQEQARNLQTRIADISGAQIAEIGKATNAYMTAYYNDWPSDGNNASDKSSSDDGGPRNCNSSDICTISISTLVNNGFLSSWNPNLRNPFRSPYEIVIKRNSGGATGMPILNALIATSNPYIPKAGGEVSFDLLGRAIQTAGAQAGFSRNIGSCSDTSICGYGGSFTVDGSEYNNIIDQEGQLGYYTGVTAQSISGGGVNDDYLRRDGTLPMYGNLDMGEGDIYNVRRIQGSETTNSLSDPNNTETNPVSSMRIGNIRVSSDPADLPAVNAAPEFSTAANVPSTFRGSVTIDDSDPNNGDFLAIFRQNTSGNQREFEAGVQTRTRFNNQDEAAVEIAGGIQFADGSSSISNLGRGPDSQSSNYSLNSSNFTGTNRYGNTPVLVNDSLSVAGVLTNNNTDNDNGGLRMADSEWIDLSTKSHTSDNLSTSSKPLGSVTIGGENVYGERTNLKVNNGSVFVGDYYNDCSPTYQIGCNPYRGEISADNYYIRDVSKTQKLSELLPAMVLKDIVSTSGYNYYTNINKPSCGDGEPLAISNLYEVTGSYGGVTVAQDMGSYWRIMNRRYGGGTNNPASRVFIYCDYR